MSGARLVPERLLANARREAACQLAFAEAR